jgi:WD40 repeat protein
MNSPEHRVLISATADQTLRFWDLKDLQSQKYILGKMHCNHAKDDQITQMSVDVKC